MRHLETRSGIYRDSVRLMEISAALATQPGIESALVAMATPVNLELLGALGYDGPASSPNDLLIAIAAADDGALRGALDRLEHELAGPSSTVERGPSDVAPRTTASAVRASGASVVLVSTPGPHAFVEAMDALEAGASVLVFSDNVPVEQEIRLKEFAAERGRLVMGPDCGTAVVGGVGLGFANVVRPGPVGLVAASGTGAQQVMSLLSAVPGAGLSHCLGVGGRDLSAAVAGRSTHAALDLLDADPATELIVVLGKPPAPEVAEAVRAHAQRLATPVIVAPLGAGHADLTAVAEQVLARLGRPTPAWLSLVDDRTAGPGTLRGLFSGGTLCVEAQLIAAPVLGPVHSNVPLRPEWTVTAEREQHVLLDLGADEYTLGRPHPMIDFGPRLARLTAAAADPSCAVVLLDVVLGHAAHPDPAAELAPAIRAAAKPVVVSLIGTPEDPQDRDRQARILHGAGASVFASNAAAARHAGSLVTP